jgi:hypothetical protein
MEEEDDHPHCNSSRNDNPCPCHTKLDIAGGTVQGGHRAQWTDPGRVLLGHVMKVHWVWITQPLTGCMPAQRQSV